MWVGRFKIRLAPSADVYNLHVLLKFRISDMERMCNIGK